MSMDSGFEELALYQSKGFEEDVQEFHDSVQGSFDWLHEKLEEAKLLFSKKSCMFALPSTPAKKRRRKIAAPSTSSIPEQDENAQPVEEVARSSRSTRASVRQSVRNLKTNSEPASSDVSNTLNTTRSKRMTRASVRQSTVKSSGDSTSSDDSVTPLKRKSTLEEDQTVKKACMSTDVSPKVQRKSTRASVRQSVTDKLIEDVPVKDSNRGTFVIENKTDNRGTFVLDEKTTQNNEENISPCFNDNKVMNQNELLKLAIKNNRNKLPISSTSSADSPSVKHYVLAFENLRSPVTNTSKLETPDVKIRKSRIKTEHKEVEVSRCSVTLSPLKPIVLNKYSPKKAKCTPPVDEDVVQRTPERKSQRLLRATNGIGRKSLTQRRSAAGKMQIRATTKNIVKEYLKNTEAAIDNQSVVVLDDSDDQISVDTSSAVVALTPGKKQTGKKKLAMSRSCTTLSKPVSHMSRIPRSASKRSCNSDCVSSSTKKRFTRSITSARKEHESKMIEQYLAKEKQAEEKRKKKEEMIKEKTEKAKRKREERQQRVKELKKAQEQDALKLKIEMENRQIGLDKKEKEREEKIRAQMLKKQIKNKEKLKDAEIRRKMEEEARIAKLQEQRDMMEEQANKAFRKKEIEEYERQMKFAEARKLQEERAAKQALKEKALMAQKQKLALDKKEQETKQKKLELAKAKAAERIAREKKELEKIEMREKVIRDQQKLQTDAAPAATQATHKNDDVDVEQTTSTMVPQSQSNVLNVTINKENNHQSYDLTPQRPVDISKMLDDENYDITNLKSSDETDDENNPRKKIPEWARGCKLKAALINQSYQPPDINSLFGGVEPPNLAQIFKHHRPRFFKRTSSAIWDSPIMKHH